MDNTISKSKAWVGIGYPESLPENWLDVLEHTCLYVSISPLHNADVVKKDYTTLDGIEYKAGDKKKEHFHIMVVWDGPTTLKNALTVFNRIGINYIESVYSISGQYDYFSHKNSPDKAQYEESDIVNLNGFDISNFGELTHSQKTELKKEIFNYIRANNINEYSDLIDTLIDNDYIDMFIVACDNTILYTNYLKSRCFKKRDSLSSHYAASIDNKFTSIRE